MTLNGWTPVHHGQCGEPFSNAWVVTLVVTNCIVESDDGTLCRWCADTSTASTTSVGRAARRSGAASARTGRCYAQGLHAHRCGAWVEYSWLGVQLVAKNHVVLCFDGTFLGASGCANCVWVGGLVPRRIYVRHLRRGVQRELSVCVASGRGVSRELLCCCVQ